MARIAPKAGAVIKAALLVLFIVAAILVYRTPAVHERFSREGINAWVHEFGIWGPLAFMVIFVIGCVLFVPSVVFTFVGLLIFGPVWGFVYGVVGSTLGAMASFYLTRTLGHDLAKHLVGTRFRRYRHGIKRHGFATILYLRLTFVPSTIVNLGAGLTSVRAKDYFWGSLIGFIPTTFIFVFFFDRILEADYAHLLTWPFLLAVALFIFSFFIPTLVRKYGSRWREAMGR